MKAKARAAIEYHVLANKTFFLVDAAPSHKIVRIPYTFPNGSMFFLPRT